MWPFNKSKKSTDYSNLPEEVQRYYNAEERDRSGASWLLAAGTLIATVVIAVGLFFGGRWLISTIFGSDEPVSTSAPTTETSSTSNDNTNESNDHSAAEDSEPVLNPDPEPIQSENTPQQAQTPSTGSTNDSLPNTGPTGPLL